MTPEQVLKIPPRVLAQSQRESYFENGYLLVERIVAPQLVRAMLEVTAQWVERSRAVEKSDAIFDLEPGHGPDNPRLRRLSSPVEHDERYWKFASESLIPDIVADLVGPDVKFHHSKLNFKWAEGGEEVKWHQDIQYWPHTNYSPLTVGTYLHDVGSDQGPLGVIPGSHKGELFDEYNDKGQWVGCLSERDLRKVPLDTAQYLMGPAGSITIHNCRTIHGSRPNLSGLGRPLLLNVYSAADAFTYTANPLPSRFEGTIVRGRRARYAHHDPRPCQVPPDWSGGYTSLFALQQEEAWDETQIAAVAAQTRDIREADMPAAS
ncbi:MAG: phytanoyl-CoA dioxygenase family protein [Immundisolibacterales bacterium]|nr:phytanoyl-CoA dioxygenase family protein [Immundisolibacterales bacterium]